MYQLEKLNIQNRGCLFPQQQVNVAPFETMLCTFLGKLLTKPYQQRQTADGNKCAKRHFILQEEFNTRHQQKRSRAGSLTSTDLSQLLSSVGLKKIKIKPTQAVILILLYKVSDVAHPCIFHRKSSTRCITGRWQSFPL